MTKEEFNKEWAAVMTNPWQNVTPSTRDDWYAFVKDRVRLLSLEAIEHIYLQGPIMGQWLRDAVELHTLEWAIRNATVD